MLPVITEEARKSLEDMVKDGSDQWKKRMVQLLKEENPEINAILLEIAQNSSDPKNVIMAGYMVYNALEIAFAQELEE